MTQESKKGSSWWWALPAAAGLALVMTAVMLWPSASANPGVPVAQAADTATPTPAPTANPNCILNVVKSDSPDPVAEGGQITYTITVKNTGDGTHCNDLTVTDTIPTDTDCVDATVTDDAGMTINVDGCDTSGDVVWDTTDNLNHGDQVVLEMVVDLTSGASEGDTIKNEACATSSSDVVGDCDKENTKVGAPVTATPTATATALPTATVRPPVLPTLAPPPPVAPPPSSLIAPMTGSGTGAGETGAAQALALALGLTGACLLLVTGVAFARRTR